MLQWLRNRRRREIAAEPFAADWDQFLKDNVRLFAQLNPDQQDRLRTDLRIFLAEKSWEGCGGLIMTDEVRVTVSAHACLLTLELNHDYYPNVESILVYPSGYTTVSQTLSPGGFIVEGPSSRLGEAWLAGPIILSWENVVSAGRGHTHASNVALHEFAHKLDMAYGGADGVPELHSEEDFDTWANVMSRQYEALLRHIEHHGHTVLDPYAATNAAEFFAVATETFFERPDLLKDHLPSLYDVLKAFYRQDTYSRASVPILTMPHADTEQH